MCPRVSSALAEEEGASAACALIKKHVTYGLMCVLYL